MTPQEVNVMLPNPSISEIVRLKEPLKPKTKDMHILRLSVYSDIFEGILNGGHGECREYNDYYKRRCTHEEDGVRFLVPFDAISFYVGRGSRAKWATVVMTDIQLDGGLLYFYLGEIIDSNENIKIQDNKK